MEFLKYRISHYGIHSIFHNIPCGRCGIIGPCQTVPILDCQKYTICTCDECFPIVGEEIENMEHEFPELKINGYSIKITFCEDFKDDKIAVIINNKTLKINIDMLKRWNPVEDVEYVKKIVGWIYGYIVTESQVKEIMNNLDVTPTIAACACMVSNGDTQMAIKELENRGFK